MQSPTSKRPLVTGLLLVGAVVFGMVLAGSLEITPQAIGSNLPPQTLTVEEARSGSAGVPSFADLAEAVSPAVVSIRATSFESAPSGRGGGIDPFEFFFGPRDRQQQQPEQQQPREFRQDSGGSGFLVSSNGLVVTNNHVVDGASDLVVMVDEREYPATVKGTDPDTDIALLQIEGSEFPYLALGDSEALRVGDWVMAIGSPLSLDHSVTVGVVSAKDRSGLGLGRDVSFENFIQTDAAINFGNSGGPLVNLRGEVVGIATAINYGAENIGFAVPVSTLKSVLPQLRDEGRVSRGYLGLDIANLDYESAQAFGMEDTNGALVNSVRSGTPAEKAGLRHGDVVIRADERVIENTRDLIDYVSSKGPGAKVQLEVLRGGETVTKTVELAERPGAEVADLEDDGEDSGSIDWLGIQYQDLTPGIRDAHGIPEDMDGVWITAVEPSSPLYEENVRRGQVVTEVNGTAITGSSSFEEAVGSITSGGYLRLYVVTVSPRLDRPVGRFAFVRVP